MTRVFFPEFFSDFTAQFFRQPVKNIFYEKDSHYGCQRLHRQFFG